jgi:hypothetical protein
MTWSSPMGVGGLDLLATWYSPNGDAASHDEGQAGVSEGDGYAGGPFPITSRQR